jgi:adhesin/invasin
MGISQPLHRDRGRDQPVSVPTSVMLGSGPTTGAVEGRAIHLVSDDDVTVYGLNRTQFTTDAYLGQPVDTAGTRCRIASHSGSYAGS